MKRTILITIDIADDNPGSPNSIAHMHVKVDPVFVAGEYSMARAIISVIKDALSIHSIVTTPAAPIAIMPKATGVQ